MSCTVSPLNRKALGRGVAALSLCSPPGPALLLVLALLAGWLPSSLQDGDQQQLGPCASSERGYPTNISSSCFTSLSWDPGTTTTVSLS